MSSSIIVSYIVGDVFHPFYDFRVILLPHLHTVLDQLELPSASADGETSVAPDLTVMFCHSLAYVISHRIYDLITYDQEH